MVLDVNQIIVKEKGVFTNVLSPTTKAKLRLLFDVAPLGFLIEKADGYNSDGKQSVLDKVIINLDDKTGRQMMARTCLSTAALPVITTTTLEEVAGNQPKGVTKVVLKKGKARLFKDGSPMVYSGAIDRILGRPLPNTGDVVLVANGTLKPVGWGFYNSTSMFSVRLMHLKDEAFRLSSLIVDIFGDVAVIASSAAWVEKYKFSQKIVSANQQMSAI